MTLDALVVVIGSILVATIVCAMVVDWIQYRNRP